MPESHLYSHKTMKIRGKIRLLEYLGLYMYIVHIN